MGVKVLKRDYSEIYTNGTTDWLLGNVGEWQKLKIEFEAGVEYVTNQQNAVQIDHLLNAFILTNGESWGDYGFDIGMVIQLNFLLSFDTNNDGNFDLVFPAVRSFTILNMYGSTIEVDTPIDASIDYMPTNQGSMKVSNLVFYSNVNFQGCKIDYVHTTNNDVESDLLTSLIDGTKTTFQFESLNNIPSNVQSVMEPIGFQSGMSCRFVKIKKIPFSHEYKKKYEIEIEYMISSLFDDLLNFQNNEKPSFLIGDGSLTDNFNIELFPEWNNPNVKVKNDMKKTERLGNTGWFDENFNELPNDFSIDSVEYFDINGNVVDALDYSSTTKMKVIVSGVQNLGAQTECGFGFSWVPKNQDEIKEKETPFYQNCFIQSGSLSNGFSLNTLYPGVYQGAGINNASMDASNVKFTSLNGKIIFEVLLTPNAQFFNLFDSKNQDDRNYIVWISLADGNLTRNFSNRVALLMDFKQLVKNIPPAGTYGEMTNKFIEHPFSENVIGEDLLEGIVQDDFLCRLPFRIKKDGSVLFQKMIFGVEAKNIGLNREFVLEKYEVDLASSPVLNNVQQFNIDQTRGFKLELGNNKNWVKIYREPSMDTVDFSGFMAFFASKIRYEDWILNQLSPNDFFDANELNTGFNNDWVHYLRTTGWNINFFVKTNAIVNGDLLQYKNEWKFTFNDYDENQNIQTAHRYIRDSDDTLLNVGTDPDYNKPLGVILSNEPTRIEIDFEILDSGLWDINSVYAVTTIEIDRGAGRMEMRQLSSVWGSESDNPLIPIPGETKLKIVVDPTNKILTTKCLVDPDLLDDGVKYRITGRVGCYNSENQVNLGLYENRYENKYN